MDKIKDLMVAAGINEDAADKICESLENWKTSEKKKLNEQFKQRLDKAKKVCVEEVTDHKRELSRRFQIFVESRKCAIEESLRKQAIDKETKAVAALENVQNVLEGVSIDGQPNGELKAKLQRAEDANRRLAEERDKAVTKATQTMELAEKALARSRKAERELQEAKNKGRAISEGSGNKGTRRIDESRQSGRPRTTRPTVSANQNANRPAQQQGGGGTKTMEGPAKIAQDMDANL